ncbi:DUF6879 family protein [Nonomuraea sp. NPDC004702]
MFDSFRRSASERLARPRYYEDFYRVYESGIHSLDKLERGQNFKERGFASWESFAAGEWDEALSLVEEKREIYTRQFQKAAELGISERRLRVVEFPITPYVQWEFFVLRLRVELGDNIRVMDARNISDIEREWPLPEVVILGNEAMFEVLYDAGGICVGANRFTDRKAIREASTDFSALFDRGESFSTFFHREVAPLAPPAVNR